LPNVPIRFLHNILRRGRKNNSRWPSGKVWGRYGGGVGRNKSFIATLCLEPTALECRRFRRIDVFGRADLSGASLGASIRNAAGSHGHRAAACAAATSTRRACTPSAGTLAVPGACPRARCQCACARACRHYTVPISVRRSDAHHRSRHRPQQGARDGADAPRRGLLAHLLA